MSNKSASKKEAIKISENSEMTPEFEMPLMDSATETHNSVISKLLRFGVGKILLGVLLILLSVGWFFGYRYLNFLNLAPSVVAGNFAMEYKKIPYNIPSIDITFSHDIDPNTVNANSVRLYPFVTGAPTLKNPRTISYALNSKLTIGTKYLLQFTTDIATTKGTRLENEITYEMEAIGGVAVNKMIPDGATTSLSKNPIFIFNIPVVPLGSLESRDALPCPVKFTPEIKGRCTWPSANILEYRLDTKLDAATKYQVKIELGSEFLYPLETAFDASFTTTPLVVFTGSVDESGAQRFSPKDGIPLVFSAPVSVDALSKNITLKNEQGASLPYRVMPLIDGETTSNAFMVTWEKGPLPFATKFNLSLSGGLMPSPGNMPMKDGVTLMAISNAFVTRTNFAKTTWSTTGALLETEDMYTSEYYIPPAKPRLTFFLDEPVDLSKLWRSAATAVKLKEIKSTKEYSCLLTQPLASVPEFPDSLKMVMKPDLQRLDCQIAEVLPFDTEFEIIFDTSISKSLFEPVKMPYQTAKQFEIKELVLQKATELCIYATANIAYSGSGIITNPKSLIRSIGYNAENYNYITQSSTKICPEKSGLVASVAEVRLNGNTQYDFTLNSDLKDVYGTSLKAPYIKNGVTSPALLKTDEYLYFMPEKQTQVIPLDAPIVLPLQTVNLDSINLEVCSLSESGYAEYVLQQYNNNYVPDCIKKTNKKIPLKNGKWNLTTQKVDLATDVLDGNLSGNILLVRGSADGNWYHEWPEQRDFKVVYVRSNLALMMENSEKKTIVFATDFSGKTLPKDLTFAWYQSYPGCDASWTSSLKYNAEKNYYETSTSGCVWVLVAKNESYYGVVTPNNDNTSNYDFGQYGGSDSSDREYVYLHTDRPIYRAGDTVNFQGILRSFAATGYLKSNAKKIKLRVLNNKSELFKEVSLTTDSHSNFEGSFPLTTEMNTGRYSFEVLAYDANDMAWYGKYVVNDGNFYVEQYSKPVFKTEVSWGKRDLFEGDTIDVTATASYYFGGRVVNTSVNWNILAQNYYFDPKNYSDYRFGTDTSFMECRYWGNCSNHDQYLGNFQNRIDSTGTNTIKYTAELANTETAIGGEPVGTPDAKKERLVSMVAEVTDPNTGKVIAGSSTHVVHVTDGYVGINSPYWIDKNTNIIAKGVTLDLDAKVRSAKVKLELIQLQWNMVKKLGVDGVFYDEYEMKRTLEATETVTSSSDGIFQAELTPKLGGEYLIRASYTGKNGATYVSDSYSFVATDTYSLWNSGNNSVTDLTAEKTMMQPGETAIFTLKSPVATGKLIYSVEKDNTILDTKVVDITGFGQKIEIPVLPSYIPNVYIRAYLIGMPEVGGLPIFKRALSQIRVLPDSKKLTVDLTPEKPTYLPGETLKVTVQVKDANGKPVTGAIGSLAVVDASVLALLGNPEKNPFAFFYDMKRYLGTTVAVSLMNLVEKLEVKNTANGEKGGAGEGNKGGDTKKKRGIFKDTAFWTGKFTTDANGKAVIDAGKLPDNLTTWKIEAVIATDTTQIGAGRTSITTEQKVMIQENFPRFLRTGDQMDFAPVIFNRTGKRQRFTVEMQTKGAQVTPTKQEIALDNQASLPVIFQVKGVLDESANTAPVELSVTAKAEDGSEDGIQKTLMLTRGESYETTAFIGTASGVGLDDRLDLTGVREGGTLTLKTSPTLLGSVLTGLDNLLRYPYGCLEQVTSAIIPHIAVKNIHDALKSPYDLKTVKIKYYNYMSSTWEERSVYDVMGDYVVKLMGYRLDSGGFGYWNSGMSYADFALTAYALNTLADIQSLGVPVDQSMSRGALDYLKNRLKKGTRENCYWKEVECRYWLSEKLAAVTAMSKWSTDGMDALKAYKALGSTSETITTELDTLQLISGLLNQKDIAETEKAALKTTAKSLIEKILQSSLVYDPRGAYVAPDVGTSRTEATAKFVRSLALLGEDTGANSQILDNMSRFLSRTKQSDGSYGSTYETALVLKAFADRTKSDADIANTNFQATATLAGKSVYSKSFDMKNILESTMDTLDIKSLTDKEAFHVDTVGRGKLYYDLSLKYPVAANKIVSRDEWFFVETTYYDFVEYQKIEGVKQVENEKYEQGKIRYSELKYPKEVREYLTPINQAKVGQLVRVEYRVIISETRDKVAFESFIPAGSELINTRLATETKSVISDTFFDREDLMDDRYFGYSETLEPGEYAGSYAVRFTHAGNFMIPATRISEFATPEVFGQTNGKQMEVK